VRAACEDVSSRYGPRAVSFTLLKDKLMSTDCDARQGLTRIEVLFLLLILLFLVALFVPFGRRPVRDAALRTSCSNQLKQIILSMHVFEGSNRRIPGSKAATMGRFSMHAEILPYIDQKPLYDRLNFEIAGPTILDLAQVSGPVKSTVDSPNGSPFTLANIPETQLGAEGKQAGPHRQALYTKLTSFNCPVDMGPTTTASGNSYCPVVTANGARDADGNLLEALWPASGGEGIAESVPTISPGEAGWGKRMRPMSLGDIADGASNTLGMVERLKGWGSGGRQVPHNTASPGLPMQFLVANDDIPDRAVSGTTSGDNRVAVEACRKSMQVGNNPLRGPGNNDRSGSQWLQYTCHWLGCANTMGPPNSGICVPEGSKGDIAEMGTAPPSSFHSGGANCAFMDGTVRFITDAVELRVFHALGTPAGHEKQTLPY